MRIPAKRAPITALETLYRGVLYRSRLEARWAVFFDALGIRHEYEPQGFQTTWGNYLPDFWLPQFSAYAEVKPTGFTREQKGKCAEVAHGTKCAFILLDGQPDAQWYEVIDHNLGIHPEYVSLDDSVRKGRLFYAFMGGERPRDFYGSAPYDRAVSAARSARFGT